MFLDDFDESSSSSSWACPRLEDSLSTKCLQHSCSWAYFHAEANPKLCSCKSAFSAESRCEAAVCGQHLHSLSSPQLNSLRARVMSSESLIHATCPKKQNHLAWMSVINGDGARSQTATLVTWETYRESEDFVAARCCQRQQFYLPFHVVAHVSQP